MRQVEGDYRCYGERSREQSLPKGYQILLRPNNITPCSIIDCIVLLVLESMALVTSQANRTGETSGDLTVIETNVRTHYSVRKTEGLDVYNVGSL